MIFLPNLLVTNRPSSKGKFPSLSNESPVLILSLKVSLVPPPLKCLEVGQQFEAVGAILKQIHTDGNRTRFV